MRFSTTGANMVLSRTKERALDPLLVPALPALATPSIILFIRKIGERDGRVSSSVGSTGGAEAAKGSEWLVA